MDKFLALKYRAISSYSNRFNEPVPTKIGKWTISLEILFQAPILQKTVGKKNAIIDKMPLQKSKYQDSLNLS